MKLSPRRCDRFGTESDLIAKLYCYAVYLRSATGITPVGANPDRSMLTTYDSRHN